MSARTEQDDGDGERCDHSADHGGGHAVGGNERSPLLEELLEADLIKSTRGRSRSHTHTHTHTQREREGGGERQRERDRERERQREREGEGGNAKIMTRMIE